MAKRYGKCTNIGNCAVADSKKVVEILDGQEFQCPSCNGELFPAKNPTPPGLNKYIKIIIASLAVIFLVIGIIYFFSLPGDAPALTDTDNDGIEDTKDGCPEKYGDCNGCPCPTPPAPVDKPAKDNDADKDGVEDNADDCPNEKGVKSLNGCPDDDNDGVANKDDKCLERAGTKKNNGCPESTPAPTGGGSGINRVNLSYGSYKGEMKNGKPHGQGELQYNAYQLISPSDQEKRYANAGDYIEGVFYNGYLTNGKWFDKNNNLKAVIIIGRWGE
jgi:hypothetical protein